MKSLFLVLILSSLSFSASFQVVSECPHVTWLAFGIVTGGGVDDLNGNTSWSKYSSTGWYRVGPYEKANFDWASGQYIYVKTAAGRVIHNQNGKRSTEFCMRNNTKFDFSVMDSRLDKRRTACFQNQDVSFARFESLRTDNYQPYGSWRIYNTSCDK